MIPTELSQNTTMAKTAETEYVRNVARVENVDAAQFSNYLMRKPFSDPAAARYLTDISQILTFLPRPPARLLDLGVGSGWTSEIFASCGYDVVGLDISSDMIEIANRKLSTELKLTFAVYDYEDPLPYGDMDAVVIYDALHHAENESVVVERAYAALRPDGVFVCIEPGRGHALTEDTQAAVRNYGTTEKDMPFTYVGGLLRAAGFRKIEQYLRLAGLPLFDISTAGGEARQLEGAKAHLHNTTREGLSSTIVARR
jgi:SAM-dependent methyltransferase